MHRQTKIIFQLLCLILCFSHRVPFASENEIHVMTEEFPPFNYRSEDAVEGLSTRIVRTLLEKARLKFRIELVPWKRAYHTAINRPNTLIYTIARTASREDQFHWIGKISNRKVSLFRLRSRQDLADMTLETAKVNAKIACTQGDASAERIVEMGFSSKNLTLMPDATTGSLSIKHVIKGRSDFFPMNPYTLKFRIRNGSEPDIFESQFVIYDADGYYVAANIDSDPELVRILQTTFEEMVRDGFIEGVIRKFIDH